MKPVPLLLRDVILAPSLGLTILALIRRSPLSLTKLMTLIRAIALAPPARAANDDKLRACLTRKLNAVRNRLVLILWLFVMLHLKP